VKKLELYVQKLELCVQKLELCVQKLEFYVQKILEAFLAYGNQQKAAFCHLCEKAAHNYVVEIDALKGDKKLD
jgi:hypothetical protein